MDNSQITFESWNKLANLYQDLFMHLDLYNDTYDVFCEQIIINPAKLLEIGCGPGNITNYLLKKRPDFKIKAIDVSPNMIELAAKNNPSAEFKIMDCREIDKLETRFDAVICGFCIPYLSDTESGKLIKDCYKLLHDEGILYLSFVEGDYNNSGFQIGSMGDKIYFYYHSRDNLIKEFYENKFEIIKISEKQYTRSNGSVEIHTIFIANKHHS